VLHRISLSPGANSKEFLVIILGEAKVGQFPPFEPAGRFWKLPEASLRMVKKSFQRAKGDLSNSPLGTEAKGQGRFSKNCETIDS